MNPVLEEIVEGLRVRRVDGESHPLHSSISDEDGLFLQYLVRQIDPTVTLEVGLANGVSALYICDALRLREGTRHIAIDPTSTIMTVAGVPGATESGWRTYRGQALVISSS